MSGHAQLRAARPDAGTRTPAALLQRRCACGTHSPGGTTCTACAAPATEPARQVRLPDVLESPGQPLEPDIAAVLGQGFGRDLSQIRVHADTGAARSAAALGADAYTVGPHIAFAAGALAPRSPPGRRLLAHEVSHALQQGMRPATPDTPLELTEPGDAMEQAAERGAAAVMQGAPPPPIAPTGPRLARQAATDKAAGGEPAKPTPAPAPAPARPELQSRMGITKHGFGVYNATLDRSGAARKQPCKLILEVMINFIAEGAWPPGRFERWVQQFTQAVTQRWSFRYMLAPTAPCPAEPCTSAMSILRVTRVATSASNVIDLHAHSQKPDNAHSAVNPAGSIPGRSNISADLYGSDVERPGSDARRNQTVAVHEAGHMLGLEHIHCNKNDSDCYGTTREESADVMGRGDIVSERDYQPFAEAAGDLAGCPWRTVGHGNTKLFPPSLIAPLAVLGGVAGALGGAALGAASGLGGALLGAGLGALLGGLVGGLSGAVIDEVD
jgi:hypothetical protein